MEYSILIVDDNKINIKILRKLLENLNLKIDECYDGQECVEKIKAGNKYDFILMDLMMPNLDGYQALKVIRDNFNLTTPVIAVTADAVSGVKEKCMQLGFNDYITKPVYKEQLINSIVDVLSKASM